MNKESRIRNEKRKPLISIIAAIGENRELGKGNKLLWHIPEDMKRFREITSGHPVIMGRTTFESIGRPLPDRINIVITRNANFHVSGCIVCHSLEEAVETASKKDRQEIFIIGGGQVYKQAIKTADKLYLTIVEGEYPADTYFPDYSHTWKVVYEKKSSDGKHEYTFRELERVQY